MAYTPITIGSADWGPPVNAAFVDQDSRITTNASSIVSLSTQVSTNTANIATNTTDIAARLIKASNLSDLTNVATARTNLGLGGAAVLNVGTTAGTVAAGDDSRIVNAVPKGTLVVNVKDFGALGNNTGDDAAAINSAITALGAAGGVLYFPPGDYRLGSATFITLAAPITVQGSGPGATTIRLSSAFTGAQGISVTSDDCVIKDIQIRGGSTTTTSNPVADGVLATGALSFRVLNSTFQYINGYAIKAFGTATNTLHGGVVDDVKIQSCAGGIWIKSDTTNTPANFQISNLFTRFTGVNSGGSANLDCLRIEDSWDVLVKNAITWMNATTGGTGVAVRVRGDCAATFIQNLDALGPQTGTANVLIQGNGTTSPQNVQISGGVIQQGGIGLLVTDATQHVRVENMRILNNQTHGVSIESTAQSVYVDKCLFSNNGQGATGSNYDINVTSTGTDLAFLTYNRHSSGTVSIGTAGIQAFHNVTAATRVRVFGANFAGSTGTVANWFAGSVLPNAVHHSTAGNNEFTTGITFRATGLTNARIGTATLSAGTVTVSNTSVTANTHIVLTGGTGAVTANAGALFVSAATAGTGFTVKSTNAADTSAFGYILIERL